MILTTFSLSHTTHVKWQRENSGGNFFHLEAFLISLWNAPTLLIMTIPCWNLISKTLEFTAGTIPSISFPFLISLGPSLKMLSSSLVFLYSAYAYFSYLSKPLLKRSWWKHFFFFFTVFHFPTKLYLLPVLLHKSLNFLFQASQCYCLTHLRPN